jgi:UDP-N-acetylglucosamine 2-epimerase (non-hydrolysing)
VGFPSPGSRADDPDGTAPVDYRQLVSWIRAATLIITNSSGIQEEAPPFGKPTPVLQDTTERPEGIEAGIARLVGTDEDRIFMPFRAPRA